ncbi:MAG: hypothetical protein ABL956_11305 [Hyphomonadaceae bacterium]
MSRALSLWLDAARAGAAVVVLLSHFAYAWASGGGLAWIRDWNLGSDAVVLFFVLSGLVIAHTTAVKDHTPGGFALAVLVAAHFLGMSRLLKRRLTALERLAPLIRWISGRTFSIYLFHMPLLKLGACVPGYDPANPLHAVTLLCSTIAGCLVLAEFTERRLPHWRSMIASAGNRVAQTAARIWPTAV